MSDLRMPDINRVTLAGRLTRDPELRYTTQGTALCKLGMAVSRFTKGRDGEKKEETFFIDVTVWEKLAEYCGERLRKGRPVWVEGRLRSDEWDDKTTGQKRSKFEVVAQRLQELDWADRGASGGSAGSGGGGAAASQAAKPEPREIEEPIPEDDVPF